MYTEVSDNYKTTINGYSRRFTARLKRDGEILAAEIKAYSLGKYSSTGEDFSLGCAFSSSVTISCVTDVPLKDQEVVLDTGLYIGSEVEYVPDGVYTITSAKKRDLITELIGYDRMYTAGQNTFQVPELPVTLSAASVAVAEQLGCGFDSACLTDVEDLTLETMPAGATVSEVSGYLAGLIGKNAYIDRSGRLTFKAYADFGYTFDGNRISDMNTDSSARTINWLECTVEGDGEESILQSGTGSGYIRMENPMMTQETLDNITAGIAGFSYYGAEIPFLLGDSRLDPWDIIHYKPVGEVAFTDENGSILTDEFGNTFVDLADLLSDNYISVCCHEIAWKFDGGLSMDVNSYALSESEENTNFRGPMQAQIDQAKQAANAAQKAAEKAMETAQEVDHATQMLTGAKGGYVIIEQDEETGYPWRILVMDAPSTEDAINIIQINKNGIGFSTSGIDGPYKNAWTIDGQLVADFVTAGNLIAGTVGGWTIGENLIQNEIQIDDYTYQVAMQTPDGVNTTNCYYVRRRLTSGSEDEWEYVFRIRYDGRIVVTRGTIGGWTVSDTAISQKETLTVDGTDYVYHICLQSVSDEKETENYIFVRRYPASQDPPEDATGWEYLARINKYGDLKCQKLRARKSLQCGRVDITPSAADTPTSIEVKFDELMWKTPAVVATVRSSVPGTTIKGVGVTGESAEGFTLWLTRGNTTETSVSWIAFAD